MSRGVESDPGLGDDPALALRAAAKVASARTTRKRAASMVIAAMIGAVLGVIALGLDSTFAGVFFFLVMLVGFAAAVVGLVSLAEGASGRAGRRAGLASVGVALAGVFMSGVGMVGAFFSTMAFSRGRQLRSRGRVLLARVATGSAWSRVEVGGDVVPGAEGDERRALAAQWRENGRTEHASVAAFARLTLDLMALGAPPELVAAANRDALDEIRHTELCFALARALDGEDESPGPFPEALDARTLSRSRRLALAELAVHSLIDGALHEGVSARVVAKLAARCEDPSVVAILKEIAADEGRHARHGWDVVRYCLDEGGEGVARALEGALMVLPRTMRSPLAAAARGGAWERWGIMGEALESSEYEATLAYVERRVREATSTYRAAA